MGRSYDVCWRVVVVVGVCSGAAAGPRHPPPALRSFLASHPPAADAATCTDARYAAILNGHDRRPIDRARAWARLARTCSIEWYDVAHERTDRAAVRAMIDYGSALLAAGYPHDCRTELAGVVTPYSSGLAARADASGDEAEQDLATQASALDDRCAAAFERQLADFTPATCDEHRTTACFEPGDADDACGGVEEHPRRGAPITLRASSGPLVDPSFCCALDTFSVATRGRVWLLRVGTQGIARVCGGGTAARVLDAIYRIRGHRLELVADESIGLH